MRVQLVGIREGETKNGKPCYNYYGLKDFSDYDKENSKCEGMEPVSAFSYKDYGVMVGDIVDFQYEPGYEGKAVLSNIVMIEMHSGSNSNPFIPESEKTEKKTGGK